MNTSTFGLSSSFGKGERCHRCDSHLDNSTYKGETVVYSISKHHLHGFICVNCITHPLNSHRSYYQTELQLKDFLEGVKV